MNYAVVQIKGHQYQIAEGDELSVDKIGGEEVSSEVLLVVKEDKVQVGTPVLKNAKVIFKVLGESKGKKIDVLKYKSKSRYRKHIGFRPKLTNLRVEKIQI